MRIDVQKKQAQVDLLTSQVRLKEAKEQTLNQSRVELQNLKNQLDFLEKSAQVTKELRRSGASSHNVMAASSMLQSGLDEIGKLKLKAEQQKIKLETQLQPPKGFDWFKREIGEGIANRLGQAVADFGFGLMALPAKVGGAFFSSLTDVFSKVTSFLKDQITQSLEAFKNYQAIGVKVNIATQGKGSEAMDFLQQLSDKYSVNFQVAADSYSKLAASMLSAGKSMQEVNFIYESLATSGRALGLSNENLAGIFTATEQIFSKQKITAEELRQQLGDRLPGAVSLLAKSLGISTKELDALMKKGEVSSDAMFDFARKLKEQYGSQVPQALGTTAAAQDRLTNSIFKIQRDFGEAINPFNQAAIETAGDILDGISREVFTHLNDRAKEFQQYLEANPEIVKQISDEINVLLNEGLNYLADKAGEFLRYLEKNPDAIAQAIDKAGQFAESLGKVTAAVADIASHLGDAVLSMDALVKGGGDLAGTLNAGSNLGIPPERMQQLQEQAKQETLRQMNVPDWMGGFFLNSARGRDLQAQILRDLVSREAQTNQIQGSSAMPTYTTGTGGGQQYGDARPNGRQHAGVDLDISRNGTANSFLGGVVTRVDYDPNGYGHYVDIFNRATGVVERIAEAANILVQEGDAIAPGQVVGKGESSTGVIHYEIRSDINPVTQQAGFGFNGSVNPLTFLQQQGLVKLESGGQGTRIIPVGSTTSEAHAPTDAWADPERRRQFNAIEHRGSSSATTSVDIAALARAVAGQESENGQDTYNEDTGASGHYQIMPENVGPWSREILGHELSYDEFMANPELQKKIAEGKMRQYYDQAIEQAGGNQAEAVRRVGAAWYGGEGNMNLFDDPTPQYSNGHEYPSFREYTTSVLDRYQQVASNPSFITTDPGTSIRGTLNTGPSEAELEKQRRELQSLQDQKKKAERELQDQQTEVARNQRDTHLSNLEAQAAENESLQSLIGFMRERNQVTDQYDDQLREYSRTVDDLKAKNDELHNAPLESDQNAAARDEAIAANEKLIQQYEQQQSQIESLRRTELESLQRRTRATLQNAETQRQLEMAQYRAETAQQRQSLSDQIAIANAPNSYQADLLQSDANTRSLQADTDAQVQELNQQLQTLQQGRQEYLDGLGGLSADEVQNLGGLDAETLQSFDNQIADVQTKVEDALAQGRQRLELELSDRRRLVEEHQRQLQAVQNDTSDQLASLRDDQVERQSGIWVANDMRRQQGAGQIMRDTDLKVNELERAGLLTDELKTNLYEIAQIQIDGLSQQFQSLEDAIDETLTDSFKQFFTDLITGSKSAGEAFLGLINSIMSSLAQLAINQIFTDLLGGGSIFGGKSTIPADSGSGIFGAVGGIIGAITGGGIPGFADGGIITKPTLGLIGEAGYHEAVIPMPNGKIGVELKGNKSGGGDVNTNIHVNVNNAGASTSISGNKANALSRELESTVLQVIQKHRKPGGLLYGN
ncbi:MAG TPA: tape measure protein [Trichocoleus sp.]